MSQRRYARALCTDTRTAKHTSLREARCRQAAHTTLEKLDRMSHVHFTNPDVLAGLRREYEQKVERDRAALEDVHLEGQQLHAEELQWARRHLLLVEKAVVIDAFHHGHISQAVQEKLLADIDAQLLRLESGETDEFNEQEPSPDRTDANNPTESLGAK